MNIEEQMIRMEEIATDLAAAAGKLGFNIKPSDICFDDSRSWSLFVFGSVIGVSSYKFGAYRDYHGGGVRGAINNNGRSKDNTVELGKLFESALLDIEALINEGYEDADPWELPTGVLM